MAEWWTNSDRDDYGQEHVGDIADGLPWPDEYFDYVLAHHSLQALTYEQLDPAIAELARVTTPGGRLLVTVPDVLQAFNAYRTGNAQWGGFLAISEPWSFDRKFAHYLTWGGTNRSCFTRESLAELLERHGFEERPVTLERDRATPAWPGPFRVLESITMEARRA